MHFVYTFFIALANNLDNISVRIAYSIRGIKISIPKNLWISVITFFFSSLAAFSGKVLSKFLNSHVTSIISMILLVSIGLWIMLEPYLKKEAKEKTNCNSGNAICSILKKPEKADADDSKDIDFKEATLLGIALSINNIGGSLSAGMIGLNSFFIGLFSALISFLALLLGNFVTGLFSKWNLDKRANILAGIMLIIIGLDQIF